MPSVDYIQRANYDALDGINVPFTIDTNLYTNTFSSYAGQLGEILLTPDFSNVDNNIRDSGYFFDFGDGTISEKLSGSSASHIYDIPGRYTINLIVNDLSGNVYKSFNNKSIEIEDIIPDTIKLSFLDSINTQSKSSLSSVMVISRYNTVRASNILSANNYPINISVSGANNFFTREKYYSEKDVQLKNTSFFLDRYNKNFQCIDGVITTSENIYVNLTTAQASLSPAINKINYSTENTEGSFFVGTSGVGVFLYYED